MPLITCPECNKQVSTKAEFCPHCGLPAKYFLNTAAESISNNLNNEIIGMDYSNLQNLILSFERDYTEFFGRYHYVSSRQKEWLLSTYGACYSMLLSLNAGYCIVLGDPAITSIVIYKKLFGYEMGREENGRQYTSKINKKALKDIYNMARQHNQLILAK